MKIKIKAVVFALLAQTVLILDSFAGHTLSISMHNGEKWWGGANSHGSKMPFDKNTSLVIDLCKDGGANQSACCAGCGEGCDITQSHSAARKVAIS